MCKFEVELFRRRPKHDAGVPGMVFKMGDHWQAHAIMVKGNNLG
jgi:hypothetical protein